MKTIAIEHCKECTYYMPDDIDEYHGCAWSPARCKKVNRSIYPKKDLDGKSFPSWCPLEDKK